MTDSVIPERTVEHGRNCSAWHSDHGHEVNAEDCTCGYKWRIYLETEKTLKAAWEKRAYEAEAKVSELQSQLTKYPIHGPVTISVVDVALKLSRAEEKVAELEEQVWTLKKALEEDGADVRAGSNPCKFSAQHHLGQCPHCGVDVRRSDA